MTVRAHRLQAITGAICPICIGGLEGLTPGLQVAVAVLLAALLLALTAVGRVVWRVWAIERDSATAHPQKDDLVDAREAGA